MKLRHIYAHTCSGLKRLGNLPTEIYALTFLERECEREKEREREREKRERERDAAY